MSFNKPNNEMIRPTVYNLRNQTLVMEMQSFLEEHLRTGTVVFPTNNAVQLAYLMHVNPKELFVECTSGLPTPVSYLKFCPDSENEQPSLGRPKWVSIGSTTSDKALCIKEIFNAYYFYTLPFSDFLNIVDARDLGF